MVFVQLAVLSTLWYSSAMKILADQDAANADAVAKCYSGPEQGVWELVMGKQIDIGAASSTLELAQRAHVGPGMKGVELNSNNGGGMRALVRLAGVDSMIGVELTKSVVETGRKRTEEEGLSDKIKFINKNSLENGLPDPCLDGIWKFWHVLAFYDPGCLCRLCVQQGCLVLHA
eukprot:s1425_g15.t1